MNGFRAPISSSIKNCPTTICHALIPESASFDSRFGPLISNVSLTTAGDVSQSSANRFAISDASQG